jgi:hypothetical protein
MMDMIDYDGVMADRECPAYIKNLVRVIKDKGNTTVGTWIQTVSTIDLLSISAGELIGHESKPRADIFRKSFMLLVDILSAAEGLDLIEEGNELGDHIRSGLLSSYISFELIKRKGIDIKIFYENMSLNEDFSGDLNNPIVEESPSTRQQMKTLLETRMLGVPTFNSPADKEESFERLFDYLEKKLDRKISKEGRDAFKDFFKPPPG